MKYLFENFNPGTSVQIQIKNKKEFKETLQVFKLLNIITTDRTNNFRICYPFNRTYKSNMTFFRIFSYPHNNTEIYNIYDIPANLPTISLKEFKEKLNINFI